MAFSDSQKNEAKKLFLDGKKVVEIEDILGISRRTIYSWIAAENWGEGMTEKNTIAYFHQRLIFLSQLEPKTPMHLKEMEITLNTIERLEKIEHAKRQCQEQGVKYEPKTKEDRAQRQTPGNDFSDVTEEFLVEKLLPMLFEYQKICWENRGQRRRNILKSRQIGMTYYFAAEALVKGITTGKNQIFLSASRAQSDVFREYIVSFCESWVSKTPKGKDKIVFKLADNKKVTFYFLSTNIATAQSYHGDVYIDEYFWIAKFKLFQTVATAMSSQEQYTSTFFSTPSSKMHEGYALWSGNEHNEKRKRRNLPIDVFPSDKEFENGGKLCPDGQWRFRIPIDVAERYGCNLFNKENLINEYSDIDYRMLFECEFVDDANAVFNINEVIKCISDARQWKDCDFTNKEYHGPVWIGYDPARSDDGAAIVVVIPPDAKLGKQGKFRVLDKIYLKNCKWRDQAEVIQKLCEKYYVEHLVMDKTGPGLAVFEIIEDFFPAVEGLQYSPEEKNKMINKAVDVIAAGRLLWDASYSDIPIAFAQIKRSISKNGRATFSTGRSNTAGHADVAWAIMHCLIKESLIYQNESNLEVTCSFS